MRPRTAQEIEGLIDVHIAEEIYYREAIAMGLDQDDTVIRRRLRQKMGFISEDAAAVTEPVAGEARPTSRRLVAFEVTRACFMLGIEHGPWRSETLTRTPVA
jgi:hypothetical protein